MIKKILSIFLLFVLLVGCQSSTSVPVTPKAKFTFSPKTAKINEPITFKLKLTADEKNIEDAKNVKFEYWLEKKADEEHMMDEAEAQGDGIYSFKKSFKEPGTYFVYYHADAADMHLMEKFQFIITE